MPVLRLRISGRVQGVGYRAFVAEEGRRLGLAGWVRNRRDDTVEAVLSGDEATLAAMLAACWQGPRHAVVSQIEQQPGPDNVQPGEFRILPTL